MEIPIKKKLDTLLDIQRIDSQLDEIEKMRGTLPQEVKDLEDEIVGLKTRKTRQEENVKELQQTIADNKEKAKQAEKLVEKYEKQQENVRNNREYDALSKEIELQSLEMELMEKRNKDNYALISQSEEQQKETEQILQKKTEELEHKKKELEQLILESEEQETVLRKDKENIQTQVEEHLLHSYEKIRQNARNGLAVVLVRRDACGGCFNMVPPQHQSDVQEKKRIIPCEHCGRILAGVERVRSKRGKKPRTQKKDTKKTETTSDPENE